MRENGENMVTEKLILDEKPAITLKLSRSNNLSLHSSQKLDSVDKLLVRYRVYLDLGEFSILGIHDSRLPHS